MLHKIGKKLTVALATFALAMGTLLYAVPAFAAASDGSIAVTGNGPFASISVYQMFSQNDSNSYVLNDKWEDFFTTDAGSGGIGLTADDADLSNAAYTYIRGLGNDDAEGMATFAKQAAAWAAAHSIQATATPSATANADGTSKTATASSLAYGYYLVVPSPEGSTDQTDPSRGTDALLVNVNSATPVAIDLKTVYPTIQKVVNGSFNHASASVGDSLPFTLTSMVPDVSGYTNGYQFAIQDTLSEGLTLDKDSVKVEIGGTDVTSSCIIQYGQDLGNTFVINFGTVDTALGAGKYDATSLFTGKAGETITVTYTATLNTSAVSRRHGQGQHQLREGDLLQRPDRERSLCVRRGLHASVHVQLRSGEDRRHEPARRGDVPVEGREGQRHQPGRHGQQQHLPSGRG